MIVHLPEKGGGEDPEDDEGEDLPCDTGHHEIVAHVDHVAPVVGCGCDAATCTLQDEGEEVAEDEDPGVKSRFQP